MALKISGLDRKHAKKRAGYLQVELQVLFGSQIAGQALQVLLQSAKKCEHILTLNKRHHKSFIS